MRNLFILFIIIVFIGCSGGKRHLSWEEGNFGSGDFVADTDYVEVVYKIATGTGADSINRQIADLIKTSFGATGEDYGPMTPQQATDSLLARKNRDPEINHLPYDLRFRSSVGGCSGVASLRCTVYTMTGGAHGLMTNLFLNFDAAGGTQLDKEDLFSDTVKLGQINRQYFAKHLSDAALTEEALFVSMDQLPLPENLGVDSSGVTMLYNPYEVAPYAVGTIEYRIPYENVKPLLKRIARR